MTTPPAPFQPTIYAWGDLNSPLPAIDLDLADAMLDPSVTWDCVKDMPDFPATVPHTVDLFKDLPDPSCD